MRQNDYHTSRMSLFALMCVIVTLVGCGGSDRAYPVSGKVVYTDGRPVVAGTIEFESVDRQPKINARGIIQADGTFRLGTFADGDGAVAGKHRAIVMWPVRTEDHDPGPSDVDPRYSSYDKSGLEFTVTDGDNDFTVEVQHRD